LGTFCGASNRKYLAASGEAAGETDFCCDIEREIAGAALQGDFATLS
jgi:hypothetical protein